MTVVSEICEGLLLNDTLDEKSPAGSLVTTNGTKPSRIPKNTVNGVSATLFRR